MKRLLPVFFLLLLCLSCRTQKQIQTEYVYIERTDSLKHLSQRIDSLLRESVRRDSIHEKDSVAIVIKGDTVMIDRWHTVYKEITGFNNQKEKEIAHDTIYQTHTEYIDRYIDKEVIQEVNRLHWWQKALMWTGVAAYAIAALALAVMWLRCRRG